MKGTTPSNWTCPVCKKLQGRIWCFDCDMHFSGKALAKMREEKAVRDLDLALTDPKWGCA